jgi:small subunit ribosomal protein S3
MGQKVNPYGFRLGVTTDWKSRWFATRRSTSTTSSRTGRSATYLMNKLPNAAISRIEVERTRDKLRIDVHTARPGIVIGRKGAQADRAAAADLTKITGNPKVQLNIQEIKQPELDAALIAQGVRRPARQPHGLPSGDEACGAERPEGRRPRHPRAVLRPPRWLRDGRTEWYREGRVPLHTLRADIDYGFREAKTTATAASA